MKSKQGGERWFTELDKCRQVWLRCIGSGMATMPMRTRPVASGALPADWPMHRLGQGSSAALQKKKHEAHSAVWAKNYTFGGTGAKSHSAAQPPPCYNNGQRRHTAGSNTLGDETVCIQQAAKCLHSTRHATICTQDVISKASAQPQGHNYEHAAHRLAV